MLFKVNRVFGIVHIHNYYRSGHTAQVRLTGFMHANKSSDFGENDTTMHTRKSETS